MGSLQEIKRKDKKGKPKTAYRIVLPNREKRTVISLGIMPKKTADTCLSMVEQIAAANAAGQSYPVEVATWTANIGDDLHTKLVNAGLLRQRQRRTLEKITSQSVPIGKSKRYERSISRKTRCCGFSGTIRRLKK